MKKYNTTPARTITASEAQNMMNFDSILIEYTERQEERKRVERTLVTSFSLLCFLLISYIQLSDIQKSLIIDKVFIIGRTIETFLTFIVTL